MKTDMYTAALAEEQRLLSQLDAVRALIKAYREDRVTVCGRSLRRTDKTQRVMAAVSTILTGAECPMPTRDLVTLIEDAGIQIGGVNPIATLSAMLHRAPEFEPVGRTGWRLIREDDKDIVQPSQHEMEDSAKAPKADPRERDTAGAECLSQPTDSGPSARS